MEKRGVKQDESDQWVGADEFPHELYLTEAQLGQAVSYP
jgi:hypothetical protein